MGPVAHGGHCVGRIEGRAVFVRHALPGERVVVEVTEGSEGDRFWRADAVEVLEPSPDRVEPPCPYAGPGRCGGCDFQHVDLSAQRRLKTAVVREQLVRLGRLDADDPLVTGLKVEAVPVEGRRDDGLRWRTRQRYAVLPDGRPAMRAHRSHHLVPVDDCLIAVEDARPRGDAVPGPHGEWSPGQPEADASTHDVTVGSATHPFSVASDGFWHVHPEAPRVLVEAVLAMLDPRPGERALDLYAGVGLFARFVGERTGTKVVAVEADRRAAEHARGNLSALQHASVQ